MSAAERRGGRQQLVILDPGSGNLRSVRNAFAHVAATGGHAIDVTVSDEAEIVAASDRIVLPGQGAFADVMAGLTARPGLLEALTRRVRHQGYPFFGICVGMQILVRRGLEHGEHPGLGWLPGACVKLAPADPALKIPHMGWEPLGILQPRHPVAGVLAPTDHAYFAHSFHVRPDDPAAIALTADYGGPLVAGLAHETLFAVQFHPEKSQATGLKLIDAFLRWSP